MKRHLVSLVVSFFAVTGMGCGGPLEESGGESSLEELSTVTSELEPAKRRCMVGTKELGPRTKTTLWSGQCLVNCEYKFCMQTDGNLVLYKNHQPLWATGTYGSGANKAIMQSDGNFVVYAVRLGGNTTPVWASGTQRSSLGSFNYLLLQEDGNAVIYNGFTREAVWATGTYGR